MCKRYIQNTKRKVVLRQCLDHLMCRSQGETGVVFYLTLDVVETNCSVLSKKDWKSCEIRPTSDTPVRNTPANTIYHKCMRITCISMKPFVA